MALLRCLSKFLRTRAGLVLLCGPALLLLCPGVAIATPTGNFYTDGSDVFDDWDICRSRADGPDGFFKASASRFEPVIADQSLGGNADRAYVRGFEFSLEYEDVTRRAEAIFTYVRDHVRYTSDSSQFGYGEFAQNADELLAVVDDKGVAYGDCEDYAVLLGAMYVGAGIRSAVVLAPDHAAALVYLPDYPRANRFLTVDGESGWVWAEATGGNNPLGWMPENYMGTHLLAYELEDKGFPPGAPPDRAVTTVPRRSNRDFALPVSPFFLVLLLLWLMSSVGRRRSASRR
ncbi:MAG: transglutaminase domain-containing protein [Dehalococcoidia bacterium]|nr:MAG: transglutaminase domain-containing protein [Dehalococcoidia bacterium]